MSHIFHFNANIHSQLLTLDQIIMAEVVEQGCPYCSGPLHQAHYPRKPFGISAAHRHHYSQRFSLCCGHCRLRTTPQSVRFLGARRYVAWIMILLCCQRSSPSEKRLESLFKRFNILCSLTTWKRWRKWWRVEFPSSALWREVRGLLVNHDDIASYPRDVLSQFTTDRLINFLRLMLPLSIQIR